MSEFRLKRKRDDGGISLSSQNSQWANAKSLGIDGIQEMPVSYLYKPLPQDEISSLNGTFSSVWENKKGQTYEEKKAQTQRTPDVTVDTIILRIEKDGEILVLLGEFDKPHIQPSKNKVQCRGLVFPGGGHYERIGGRMPVQNYEPSHGSAVQAADDETLEEVGISKKSALLRDLICVMDVAPYEIRKHCVRLIFGMLVDPASTPSTSDEIKKLYWVPFDSVIEIAKGDTEFEVGHGDSARSLSFTLKHDKMFLALIRTDRFKKFLSQCKKCSNEYHNIPGKKKIRHVTVVRVKK